MSKRPRTNKMDAFFDGAASIMPARGRSAGKKLAAIIREMASIARRNGRYLERTKPAAASTDGLDLMASLAIFMAMIVKNIPASNEMMPVSAAAGRAASLSVIGAVLGTAGTKALRKKENALLMRNGRIIMGFLSSILSELSAIAMESMPILYLCRGLNISK